MKFSAEPVRLRRADRRRWAEVVGLATIAALATVAGVSPAAILNHRRYRVAASLRQEAVIAMRQRGLSLPEIGRAIGRDHTTALYLLRRPRFAPYKHTGSDRAQGNRSTAG